MQHFVYASTKELSVYKMSRKGNNNFEHFSVAVLVLRGEQLAGPSRYLYAANSQMIYDSRMSLLNFFSANIGTTGSSNCYEIFRLC